LKILKRVDRDLPGDMIRPMLSVIEKGTGKLTIGNNEEAATLFERFYRKLMNKQGACRHSIHKGAILNYIGIAHMRNEDYEKGVRFLILAYIEDVLTVPIDEEVTADSEASGLILINSYKLNSKIMLKIRYELKLIKKQISDGEENWKKIKDPEAILSEFAVQCKFNEATLLSECGERKPKFYFFEIMQPWEKRVFIGGNYDTPGNLHIISELVRARGYLPKIAKECLMMLDLTGEECTHESSMMLLHTCRYAIFDASSYSGWLMELERTRDYGIDADRVLIVRNTSRPEDVASKITGMVGSMGFDITPFVHPSELKQIIEEFLPKIA